MNKNKVVIDYCDFGKYTYKNIPYEIMDGINCILKQYAEKDKSIIVNNKSGMRISSPTTFI